MAHAVHVKLAGHHGNPPRFHQHIEATLSGHGRDGLALNYVVQGLNLDLHVPTPHQPAPADALWRTTCCEVFLNPAGSTAYREFNFSPSGQWAAYDFTDTREAARAHYAGPAPHIDCQRSEDRLALQVTVPQAALPKGDTLRIALAVILEAEGGYHGYWALAHPPGQPDFHHHAGFVLSLGPMGFRPSHWP